MPKRTHSIPRLCHCKSTGRAVVYLDGKKVYLGKWGAAGVTAIYRTVGEWLANGRQMPRREHDSGGDRATLSVNELILAYWRHAQDYYRGANGKPSSELGNIRQALRLVKGVYGVTPTAEFGQLALQAIRQQMVEAGKVRTQVNKAVGRISLRRGRSGARDNEPVRDAFVDAILPYLSPQVAAMVELQRLTGMRSGEVVIIRACDLDASGQVWTYTPSRTRRSIEGISGLSAWARAPRNS